MMEFEGRTEQEAVQKACAALSLKEQDLDYTVIDEGSGGVFGLGARPVQIRVRTPEAPAGAPPAEAKSGGGGGGDEFGDEEGARGGIVGPAPEKAAKALEVAQALATRMGLEAEVTVRDEHEQIVVVIGEKEGATAVAEILGKSRPPAIPSFQFLLNKIVNRFPEDRKHIVVEVPSVPRRERRPQEPRAQQEPRAPRERAPAPPVELDPDLDPAMVALGRALAEKATLLNKVITVHPMLPSDRRAIHQTIMTVAGVTTVSEGEGLNRRMHIVPDALAAGGGGGRKRRRRRRRGRRDDGGAIAPAEAGDGGVEDADEGDAEGEVQDAPV